MADAIDNQQEQTPDFGAVKASWEFPEFVKYNRGFLWYIGTAIVIVLLIIFSIASQNYLFIVLILLFAFIMFLRDRRDPKMLTIKLQDRGVSIGERMYYPWSDIKSFWIIYEPPEVKNLYLDFKGLRPDITIQMQNQNPLEIRKILSDHVIEDVERENESFSDGFSRMFKL